MPAALQLANKSAEGRCQQKMPVNKHSLVTITVPAKSDDHDNYMPYTYMMYMPCTLGTVTAAMQYEHSNHSFASLH